MMKKLAPIISIPLLFTSFLLHAEHRADISQSIRILAGEVHEDCMELQAGTKVNYTFESNAQLSFNVHYHVDEEIIFPVEEHKSKKEPGEFVAEIDHVYCLMWTNATTGPVNVKYTYKIRSSKK